MKILVMIAMLSIITGCNSKHGWGLFLNESKRANAFSDLLTEETGQRYKVVKTYTLKDNYVVFQNMVTGEYIAYNLDNYTSKMTFEQFSATLTEGDQFNDLEVFYQDVWQVQKVGSTIEVVYRWENVWDAHKEKYVLKQVKYEYETPIYENVMVTKTRYRDNDTGVIFEQTQNPKDLEKIGAFLEQDDINKVADHLGQKFGLSEERSRSVAKLLGNFSKLSEQRSMTPADYDYLTKNLLGSDFSAFQEAQNQAINGNNEHMDDLIERAASLNQISPEHMQKIISELY